MITNNKLEKSFGPVGSVSGMFIFIAGFFVTFFISLTGLVLILIGAFIGFTSSSTLIDFDKKKVKLSNNIFGIIKIGHWINLDSNMTIGIKKSNRVWRSYSRSNQALDISDNDFRLILYDSTEKQIIPLKRVDSYKSAKLELDSLIKQLGLI
jgi:hypothetical protein